MFSHFSKYISQNAEPLARELVEGVLRRMNLEIPDWERTQAISMYVELFRFFGDSLINKDKDFVPNTIINWSKKNAAMQVTSKGEISEIVVRYQPTREIFTEILTGISIELGLSVKENGFVIKRMNAMLDVSLNETVYSFERLLDESREKTKIQLAKLSAPIIPVKEDIVVLPLVGDIDCFRTNYILVNVVPKITKMDIRHVIIDLSGILNIDEAIAEFLHILRNVLKLTGIHVITTGIRPELAQTVTRSQMDFTGIETFANVKRALKSLE